MITQMTVGELKKELEKYDDHLVIVTEGYNGYYFAQIQIQDQAVKDGDHFISASAYDDKEDFIDVLVIA